jgi:hypothetical protein
MSKHTKPLQTIESASSSMAGEYFLAPLVFACATRNGIVLLDLRRNRYLGLERSDALALSRFVRSIPKHEEWADADGKSANDQSAESEPTRHGVILLDERRRRYLGSTSSDQTMANNLLQSMLKEGLLTTADPAVESALVSTEIDLKRTLVSIEEDFILTPRVRMRDIATFAYFLITGALALRCLPLRRLVRSAHDRRNMAYRRGYKLDVEEVCRHVCTYRAIRPLFFVAKKHPLLHALTLTNYLAHHGQFPVWVFGIGTEPWTTHTWLQHENYVLDDSPETVFRLEPILAI